MVSGGDCVCGWWVGEWLVSEWLVVVVGEW